MDERLIDGLEAVPAGLRGCVLTIGNFDGMHLGHQRILREARSRADTRGAPVAVMTFEPPPNLIIRPREQPRRITPADRKSRLLLDAGTDFVVTARTDREMLAMEPAEFIEQVVVARFAPKEIVEGDNFRFGHNRSGDLETLRRAGPAGGWRMHVVAPVMVDLPEGPRRASSTLIRELVLAGRVEDARRCLGCEFELFAGVVSGSGLGRQMGFPTCNLDAGEQVVPGDGVYAGLAHAAGRTHAAAISIGDRPTLTGAGRAVEAYLLDVEADYYNERLALRFVRNLRRQRRFETLDALKQQIAEDVRRVRDICRERI